MNSVLAGTARDSCETQTCRAGSEDGSGVARLRVGWLHFHIRERQDCLGVGSTTTTGTGGTGTGTGAGPGTGAGTGTGTGPDVPLSLTLLIS